MFETMGILVEMPWLAALPAAFFLGLYAWCRRKPVLVAASAWALYLPYEWSMKLRLLCSGECDIRIDLLALYPLLAILSLIALIAASWFLVKRLRSAASR
ncbi:MAG TPA: hypothetical protein VLG68_10705 [Gammaproteobacteria bacterium]|nr:hypothetical protein [Gammaproteobacteria bacterium]